MKFSIIVPTYKRDPLLIQCLESLVKQDYPIHKFEIVVVNNFPNIHTKKIVIEMKKTHHNVNLRYVVEKRLGLVYARHKGAKVSQYEILSYVDDDGIYSKNLLKSVEEVFNLDDKIVAVGGKIDILWDKKPPEWISKYEFCLGKLDYGRNIVISKNLYINGGNFHIKKDILFKVGGFNPDQVGNRLVGDGESGLCLKLHQMDALIGWTPKALMRHQQYVSKNATIEDIKRRYSNNGIAEPYQLYINKGIRRIGILYIVAKSIIFCMYYKAKVIQCSIVARKDKNIESIFKYSYYYSQIVYSLRLLLDKKLVFQITNSTW